MRPFLRRAMPVLFVAILAACPRGAAAGSVPAADPYDLRFSYAWQVDRFHSPAADSLGHSVTTGTAALLGFDFRVVDLPVPGKGDKPAIHVLGSTRSGGRTFATDGIGRVGASNPAVDEMPVFEMEGAVVVRVPISMVAPGAGSDFYAGYGGGLVLASNTGYDFMSLKRAIFGFERTQGFFEGSLVEMAYGRNESYGRSYAAGRWATRFRVQSRVGPGPKAPDPADKSVDATVRGTHGTPLRAFVDLVVDTDGGDGPDGIQALVGLTLDAGAVLRHVMGSVE